MSDYLDSLRLELIAANDRLVASTRATARRRLWWRRSPRTLAIALAALTVSATALAATAPWQPLFGDPSHPSPQPRVTGAAPPADQLAMLGVLRRAQTDEDRGATTRQALRYFGTSTQDVYSDYIRRLPSGTGRLAATLVPARTWQWATLVTKHDVLCVFIAESNGDGGAKGCYTTADITSGSAWGSLGAVAYGLVPDGVAQLEVRYPSGTQRIAVRDNFYEYRTPPKGVRGGGRIPVRSLGTTWLDANGQPTAHQPHTEAARRPDPAPQGGTGPTPSGSTLAPGPLRQLSPARKHG